MQLVSSVAINGALSNHGVHYANHSLWACGRWQNIHFGRGVGARAWPSSSARVGRCEQVAASVCGRDKQSSAPRSARGNHCEYAPGVMPANSSGNRLLGWDPIHFLVPVRVALRAQVRFRPHVRLASKYGSVRPVVELCSIGLAFLAFVPGALWLDINRFFAAGDDKPLTDVLGLTVIAHSAHKKMLNVSSLIEASSEEPRIKAAFWALFFWRAYGC